MSHLVVLLLEDPSVVGDRVSTPNEFVEGPWTKTPVRARKKEILVEVESLVILCQSIERSELEKLRDYTIAPSPLSGYSASKRERFAKRLSIPPWKDRWESVNVCQDCQNGTS